MRSGKAISDLLHPQSVLVCQASLVTNVKQEVNLSVTLRTKRKRKRESGLWVRLESGFFVRSLEGQQKLGNCSR